MKIIHIHIHLQSCRFMSPGCFWMVYKWVWRSHVSCRGAKPTTDDVLVCSKQIQGTQNHSVGINTCLPFSILSFPALDTKARMHTNINIPELSCSTLIAGNFILLQFLNGWWPWPCWLGRAGTKEKLFYKREQRTHRNPLCAFHYNGWEPPFHLCFVCHLGRCTPDFVMAWRQ